MPVLSDRLDKLRRQSLEVAIAADQHASITHLIFAVTAV
jgi:hypothetical protein